jgi:predicted PurR-regulated permease PerM
MERDPEEGPMPQPVLLHLSWGALGRLALAILVAWVFVKVWPEFLLLVVAVLLAVTLDTLVTPMTRRLRLSRGSAVLLLAVALALLAGSVVTFVFPPLSDQVGALLTDLPQLQKQLDAQLHGHTILRRAATEVLALPGSPDVKRWLARPFAWGLVAFEGVVGILLVFVFTFYLLLDGKALYAWLLAYVPRRHRRRAGATLPEVQEVVARYVTTQVILSTLFGAYGFLVLTTLGVPAALPLGLLAAACDAVPVLGIVVATAIATLFGLGVSTSVALQVLGLYAAYHLVEVYVLLPRLYGKRLRISPLAVLLALFVGGAVQGILGAVVILPLVAAYPVVERHWLSEYLSDEIVDDHQALHKAEKADRDEVVDAVLRGDPRPAAGR